MKKPTLDVLVPHYQDPNGLQLSLLSIIDQEWKGRLRVIVADDGSDRENFDQVQSHCQDFQRLSAHQALILRRDKNKGRPYTRNELLDAADASHIAWLDAGDTWERTKLQCQFDYLSQMHYGGRNLQETWITCDYTWIEGNLDSRRVVQDISGDQFKNLMSGERLRAYLWTLLGTRESFTRVGYFDERLTRLQDLDYFVRFVRGGGKILKPRTNVGLATYYKNDIGRNANEVYAAYSTIIRKNTPQIIQYPRTFSKDLNYKAAKLAARFSMNNGDKSLRIKYELLGLTIKPVTTSKQVVRKIIDRLTS